jgi:hypothetical protein
MHYHLAVAVQVPFADLQDLISFRAPKPFCYRWLTPALLNLLTRLGLSPQSAVAAFEWGSLCCLYYLLRAYLGLFMSSKRAAYAALSGYFVVPFVFIIPQPYTVWFPWDVSSVCFFTALLYLLYRERWVLWHAVFLAGTLNRETTLLLLPLFLLLLKVRGASRERLLHLCASALVWVAAKGALAWWFKAHSGPWMLEWLHRDQTRAHWRVNLDQLTDPSLWPYLLSALGFLWILAWHLRKVSADPFLRAGLVILPPYALSVFLFGNMAELRVYADLIPVVLAPVISAVVTPESPVPGRKGP